MNILGTTNRYMEHVSSARKASDASYGADTCYKGLLMSFPCSCKKCLEERNQYARMIGDIFDWNEHERDAIFGISKLMADKDGGYEVAYMMVLYKDYKRELLPEFFERIKKKAVAEWYAIPWWIRVFTAKPKYLAVLKCTKCGVAGSIRDY